MSSLQQRITSVTDVRLAAIAATTAKLKAQLSELGGLREQVRKAQMSDNTHTVPPKGHAAGAAKCPTNLTRIRPGRCPILLIKR